MRSKNFAPRILAVVLSACLILPPHAYALRSQQQQETEPQRVGLEEALRSGDPDTLIRVASSRLAQWIAPAPVVSISGLEETWDKHPEVLPILERYPDPAVRPGVLYGKTDRESGRDHVQRVLQIAQLLAEDAELSDKDQRLLRIAAALHDVGSLQHLDVAAVMNILKLAREKIPVPFFRLRDLADHYQLTWGTVDGLFDRIRADLGQNFPDEDLMGPVRPDVTAIWILDDLVQKNAVRFDAPADRQVVEAVIRESVWAGLLATQSGYTVALTENLPKEVVERVQRLAEFLEAADTVEASANLARAETFYSGRPRDLANLVRSLEAKIREQAISRQRAARVRGFLSPGHPRHGELIAILEKSRRIGQAGQAWSELDRQIMAREAVQNSLERVFGVGSGKNLVQAMHWPDKVLKELNRTQDDIANDVNAFVETWTSRAQQAGTQFEDPQALDKFFNKEVVPWVFIIGAGEATRVSATGLDRKVTVRPTGAGGETILHQARKPVLWNKDQEHVLVIDAVIAYRLLREGAEIDPKKERGRLADAVVEELSLQIADIQAKAKGSQLAKKEAAQYDTAAQSLETVKKELLNLVDENLKVTWERHQEKDTAGLLRAMEALLEKALPQDEMGKGLAHYVWGYLAARLMKELVEKDGTLGNPYGEFVDPDRVRDVAGPGKLILVVAPPKGAGGAFQAGVERLRKLNRLHEHQLLMPVYGDYSAASREEKFPNVYLYGLVQSLAHLEDPNRLPVAMSASKATLSTTPKGKGNYWYHDNGKVGGIGEWRELDKDPVVLRTKQLAILRGYGQTLWDFGFIDDKSQFPTKIKEWDQKDNKGNPRLDDDEKKAIIEGWQKLKDTLQGERKHELHHGQNAGVFWIQTDKMRDLLDAGLYNSYGKFDHPDSSKGKLHEFWYTDLVEVVSGEEHNVLVVVPLGIDTAPAGIKDSGRLRDWRAELQDPRAGSAQVVLQNDLPTAGVWITDEDLKELGGLVVAKKAQIYLFSKTKGLADDPKVKRKALQGIFEAKQDMVWILEGVTVLEDTVRIFNGAQINDPSATRPTFLQGGTVIGRGRSVAAAELNNVVLEGVLQLDGFSYPNHTPRVGSHTDVWNVTLQDKTYSSFQGDVSDTPSVVAKEIRSIQKPEEIDALLRPLWPFLEQKRGALVFDVDETLLPNRVRLDGKQVKGEDLPKEQARDAELAQSIRSHLVELLRRGVRIVVISGNARITQTERVTQPLRESLSALGDIGKLQNLVLYTSGGATLSTFDAGGAEVLDTEYNSRYLLSDQTVESLRKTLETFLVNTRLGLNAGEVAAWKEWYATRKNFPGVTFYAEWLDGKPFSLSIVKPDQLPEKTSAPYLEHRDGVQASVGLLPKEPRDVRPLVIQHLRAAAGSLALKVPLILRPAGYASIDIGFADKEVALAHEINRSGLDPTKVFYFGDGFSRVSEKGTLLEGNDTPVLNVAGIQPVAVGDLAPFSAIDSTGRLIYGGKGPSAVKLWLETLVAIAKESDLAIAKESGLEETQTFLRSGVSGPVMMDVNGVPQTVFRHRISVSAALPDEVGLFQDSMDVSAGAVISAAGLEEGVPEVATAPESVPVLAPIPLRSAADFADLGGTAVPFVRLAGEAFLEQEGVLEAIEVGGGVLSLGAEAATRLLGQPAVGAMLIRDGTSPPRVGLPATPDPNRIILADRDIPARENWPWVKVGDWPELRQALVSADPRDYLFVEEEPGVTRGVVEVALREAFPQGQMPLTLLGSAEAYEALPDNALDLLAREGQPPVVVLWVEVELKSRSGETFHLIIMT